jgi:hypothetical protein
MEAHRAAASSAAGFAVDTGVACSHHHLFRVSFLPRAVPGRQRELMTVENLRRLYHTTNYIPELLGAT